MKLLFYFPSFFSLIFCLSNGYYWFKADFVENIIFTTLLYLLYLFLEKRYYRKCNILILVLLYLVIYLELISIVLYKNVFNKSIIFILLETNSNEIYDFLQTFKDRTLGVIIISIVYWAPIILKGFITKKNFGESITNNIYFKSFQYTLILIILFFTFHYKTILLEHNLLYNVITGYSYYNDENNKASTLHSTSGDFESVEVTSKVVEKELHFIIIGESATRNHMSIYGYNRMTNPLLSSIDEDLTIYTDVISPHVHTIASLSEVLTLKNHLTPTDTIYKNNSIIQLLNCAGYNTYWVSNQAPLGVFESYVTHIAKATKKQFFINPANGYADTKFDGELFGSIDKIIAKKENKQVVFIHLLGSHTGYEHRYPQEFNAFQEELDDSIKKLTINHYDNSILYNDYVIYSLINKLKKEKLNSFLLYFSDHGEDVYDYSKELLGHSNSTPTPSMYEIPFIFYSNKSFRLKKHILDSTRKYMTDDLLYSVADILNISFKGNDTSKSIFSEKFIEIDRVINNGESYEYFVK